MTNVPITFIMPEADRARLVTAYCGNAGFTGTPAEMLAKFKEIQDEEWQQKTKAYFERQTEFKPLEIT